MKLSLFSHKKKIVRKKVSLSLHPRTYWVWLLSVGVLLLALELLYFSFVFWNTTKVLDSAPTPVLETNAVHIRSMDTKLNAVEEAVRLRTGRQ